MVPDLQWFDFRFFTLWCYQSDTNLVETLLWTQQIYIEYVYYVTDTLGIYKWIKEIEISVIMEVTFQHLWTGSK